MDIILLAVPAFFILIGIELAWNYFKGTDYYRLNDAINSLSMGMLSRVSKGLYALIPFSIYTAFYQDFALFTWEDNLWTFALAFVLYDLCYYWSHRLGHVLNIGWASHVIHHSSEEYNLTTALRQTSVPHPLGMLCYIPLALLGFDPATLLAVASINLVYQFWVHTQLIDRMPEWYEALFVTPSNHRVHHAKNKIYVDKNYGGVFILWDRLFKTFQPELKKEKVIFGISTQLASWNPLWGNLKFVTGLFKDAWRTESWKDKFTLWFRHTGYRPADIEAKYPIEKSNAAVEKFEVILSTSEKWYVFSQYILISVASVAFMALVKTLPAIEIIIYSTALIYALFSLGKVQEKSRYTIGFELLKFALSSFAAILLFSNSTIVASVIIASTISLIFLLFIQKQTEETVSA